MQASNPVHNYWLLLKDLSAKEKLSLIELLVKSLQTSKRPPQRRKTGNDNWVTDFAGSWNDFPESAEQMIDLIENARTQPL